MNSILMLSLGTKCAGPVYGFEMAKALSKYLVVFVVVSKESENVYKWRKESAMNNRIVLHEVHTFNNFGQFIFATLILFRIVKIVRIINRTDSQYLYTPMIHIWSSIINLFIKNKIVVNTIHDVKLHVGERNIIANFLNNLVLRQSKKVIVLSDIFKPEIQKLGFSFSDICVVPHANFNYYVKSVKDEDTIFNRILFFGRIHKYKGVHILLKAFQNVLQYKKDLQLRIVGRGNLSEYSEDLERNKDNLQIFNQWIADDDVSIYFEEVDFVVVPYIEGSQSGVIPLSFSFGKPVIATKVGGIIEQVKEENGILIEPNNIEQLSEKILWMYSHPDRINVMSRNAYSYATQELTWDTSAKKLLEFLS